MGGVIDSNDLCVNIQMAPKAMALSCNLGIPYTFHDNQSVTIRVLFVILSYDNSSHWSYNLHKIYIIVWILPVLGHGTKFKKSIAHSPVKISSTLGLVPKLMNLLSPKVKVKMIHSPFLTR